MYDEYPPVSGETTDELRLTGQRRGGVRGRTYELHGTRNRREDSYIV